MFDALIRFIRAQYGTGEFIPLHAPVFAGNERSYVLHTIDSTFVSSVGPFVDRFEREMAAYTGSPRAVATVNGTAALHVALLLAGVRPGDLVLTQALTFVGTCNAIAYCGAQPVFLDVDRETLGLSPAALSGWLEENVRLDEDGVCRTRQDGLPVRVCVPMHTFGHPVDIDGLMAVCARWRLTVVEDAAESLGSFYKGASHRHVWTVGNPQLQWQQDRDLGIITAEIAMSESRHVLLRSLGPEMFVSPDTTAVSLQTGDTLVLCTDGLHDEMQEAKIARDRLAEEEHATRSRANWWRAPSRSTAATTPPRRSSRPFGGAGGHVPRPPIPAAT